MADTNSSAAVVQHNLGGVDQFGYSIAFLKHGSGKTYAVPSFVPEFNIYESLNTKALSLTMSLLDGAGLVKAIALQPGDGIQVTLYKDPNGKKIIIDDFIIQDINSGHRVPSGQGESYVINATQKIAVKNLVSCVNKAYKGTMADVAKAICKDALDADLSDVEQTTGAQSIIFPSCRAFSAIDWVCRQSLSSRPDSLFYFWAGTDNKLHFKSYRSMVSQANVHPYVIGTDNTRIESTADVFRIEGYQRNNAGNQTDRLHSGMLENELLQFNVKSQTFSSKKFRYQDSHDQIHVLSSNPVGDLQQNIKAFQTDANTKHFGVTAHVKVRSDESAYGQFNSTEKKHGHTVAQARLLNQISYTVTMRGDPSLCAGDVIDIKAPELSAVEARAKGFDPLLNGKFLIVNVRHQVTDGNAYQTVCDIFRDGPDVDVFSNKNGA